MEPSRDAKRKSRKLRDRFANKLNVSSKSRHNAPAGLGSIEGERVTDEMAASLGRRSGVGSRDVYGVVHRGAVRCLGGDTYRRRSGRRGYFLHSQVRGGARVR